VDNYNNYLFKISFEDAVDDDENPEKYSGKYAEVCQLMVDVRKFKSLINY